MLFILKNNGDNHCDQILKFIDNEDKIILIQDGVLLAHENNKFISTVKDKDVEILVLKNDLDVRGAKNNINAKTIDYADMVDLIEKNKVFS